MEQEKSPLLSSSYLPTTLGTLRLGAVASSTCRKVEVWFDPSSGAAI